MSSPCVCDASMRSPASLSQLCCCLPMLPCSTHILTGITEYDDLPSGTKRACEELIQTGTLTHEPAGITLHNTQQHGDTTCHEGSDTRGMLARGVACVCVCVCFVCVLCVCALCALCACVCCVLCALCAVCHSPPNLKTRVSAPNSPQAYVYVVRTDPVVRLESADLRCTRNRPTSSAQHSTPHQQHIT